MKLKVLAALTAIAISQSAFAAPAACPEVNALQKVGIELAGPSQYGWIGATRANNYGTQDSWAFLMFGITDANSDDEALTRYNNALGTLAFQQGPLKSDGNNEETWGCIYSAQENGNELMAVTVTPIPEGYPALKSISKFSFK